MAPSPVPENVVCSECGLPWKDHRTGEGGPARDSASWEECVRLLKAELKKRPVVFYSQSSAAYPRQPLGGTLSGG